MEEKKPTLSINSLTYGLLTAIVVSLYSILLMSMDVQSKSFGYISYLFIIIGMVYGSKNYREKTLGGYMTYGDALKSCTYIAVFIAAVSGIFIYIYTNIDNSFIEKAIVKAQEEMEAKNMEDEQIEIAIGYTRKFMQPFWMGVITFISYSFLGFVLGLIVAAFVKKENPNPFQDINPTTISE